MKVVDSGVVVAAFASWHEDHALAAAAIRERPGVTSHSLIEAFSVLTRLPAPHRAPGNLVSDYVHRVFPDEPVALTGGDVRALVLRFPTLGISGGAVYDALIAQAALVAGATLVTLDRRAAATYARIGCAVEILR